MSFTYFAVQIGITTGLEGWKEICKLTELLVAVISPVQYGDPIVLKLHFKKPSQRYNKASAV